MSATLAPSAVRARIAAVVEALTTPHAWSESRWPYGVFPTAEPSRDAHLAFAVGIPSTTVDGHIESQRGSRGAAGGVAHSSVRIAWLYSLTGDGGVSDYDAALDAEATLLAAIGAVAKTDGLHLSIESATRKVVGDGTWLVGEVGLSAQHRIQIQ